MEPPRGRFPKLGWLADIFQVPEAPELWRTSESFPLGSLVAGLAEVIRRGSSVFLIFPQPGGSPPDVQKFECRYLSQAQHRSTSQGQAVPVSGQQRER